MFKLAENFVCAVLFKSNGVLFWMSLAFTESKLASKALVRNS